MGIEMKYTPIKLNESYVITINNFSHQGEGIGRVDGFTIFVFGARPDIAINPIHIELIGNSGVIRNLKIADNEWKKIKLQPEDFADSDMLTIQVDRTWNPKFYGVSDDARDLGVAVALLAKNL